jgi:hypothetical protein
VLENRDQCGHECRTGRRDESNVAGSDEDQIHALSITRDAPRIAGDAFRMTSDAFWFGAMRCAS